MSKRAIKIAEKVLKSDGVAPARLQVTDGDFWTLQWSDLRCLGYALTRREQMTDEQALKLELLKICNGDAGMARSAFGWMGPKKLPLTEDEEAALKWLAEAGTGHETMDTNNRHRATIKALLNAGAH